MKRRLSREFRNEKSFLDPRGPFGTPTCPVGSPPLQFPTFSLNLRFDHKHEGKSKVAAATIENSQGKSMSDFRRALAPPLGPKRAPRDPRGPPARPKRAPRDPRRAPGGPQRAQEVHRSIDRSIHPSIDRSIHRSIHRGPNFRK